MDSEVIPDNCLLNDINDINNCLMWFVENSKNLKLIIEPGSMEKNKFLQLIFSQNTKCSIEHIITIESDYSKDSIMDICAFERLFPVVLYSNDYQVFHCWRNLKHEEYIYMDMMISEAGLIIFDDSLDYVFYTSEKNYVNYYYEVFEKKKLSSNPFMKTGGKSDSDDIVCIPVNTPKTVVVQEESLVQLFEKINCANDEVMEE